MTVHSFFLCTTDVPDVPVDPEGSALRPVWTKLQSSFEPEAASRQASEGSLKEVCLLAPVQTRQQEQQNTVKN